MSQSNAVLLKNAETLTFCVHVLLQLPMKNIPHPAEEDIQYQFWPYKLDVKLFTKNWPSATVLQSICHKSIQLSR